MRIARKVTVVLVALVVMTVGMALPAHAGAEGDLLSKINSSRSAAGLPPVSMHSDLVPDARNHSAAMMAEGRVYHSGNLAGVASGWEALAENVGAGPTVGDLHSAFMSSAGHRANVLGDYNYVGIGVASDGSLLWVTVIFMRKGAPPETTTTTTTAAPAPTTTTTTVAAPVVTTTTTPVLPTTPSTTPPTTAPRSASPEPTEASPSTLPVAKSGEEAEDLLQGPLPSTSQALHLPIAD